MSGICVMEVACTWCSIKASSGPDNQKKGRRWQSTKGKGQRKTMGGRRT